MSTENTVTEQNETSTSTSTGRRGRPGRERPPVEQLAASVQQSFDALEELRAERQAKLDKIMSEYAERDAALVSDLNKAVDAYVKDGPKGQTSHVTFADGRLASVRRATGEDGEAQIKVIAKVQRAA